MGTLTTHQQGEKKAFALTLPKEEAVERRIVVSIQNAETLLERIVLIANELTRTWRSDDWQLLGTVVWDFCRYTQEVHLELAGIDRDAFDLALSVLDRFRAQIEDLLHEAEQKGNLPSSTLVDEIRGVVGRCVGRVNRLDAKRTRIEGVERALALMLC